MASSGLPAGQRQERTSISCCHHSCLGMGSSGIRMLVTLSACQKTPLLPTAALQVQTGEAALRHALDGADLTGEQLPWEDIFAALDNDQRPAEADVPRTGEAALALENADEIGIAIIDAQRLFGCSVMLRNFARQTLQKLVRCCNGAGVDWEMDLTCSSIFVPVCQRDGLLYGTRSQTVAAVWASGKIEVAQRSLSEDGSTWSRESLTSSLSRECVPGSTSSKIQPPTVAMRRVV